MLHGPERRGGALRSARRPDPAPGGAAARRGPRRAGDLATALGVSPPVLSRHLRILLAAGVVADERGPPTPACGCSGCGRSR
ncbi:winged helix-turn-helix domain-containing protein [Luedemannella flava]